MYRSLIRTSNSDYVDFLSRLYRGSKSKKDYTVYKDKSYFISANKDLISINEIENIKNEVGSYMAEILNNEIKDSTIMETELIPKTCTLIQYKCMQEGSHER